MVLSTKATLKNHFGQRKPKHRIGLAAIGDIRTANGQQKDQTPKVVDHKGHKVTRRETSGFVSLV
jgi:hypothetical protein